ncbi:DNA repair protein rad50 [Modicella reniformis]|uniref:DNA repair protein RAD50 n=1 Tax=Modicella reniformis TaxID=1440133 RepID=A0A9P6SUB6_9FUNG|nr:DNA repair protein rad50 [Modicella reniformis]
MLLASSLFTNSTLFRGTYNSVHFAIKLLIRGIRSFESDSGEAATITFFSPITLITGHNGSGKTTIIECLKYVTTGDLPPGSKGGAFVNDPKMSNSPSIKAQVRLRFKNVNNQTMSIVRSLSVTVKKNAYTQKTLENVLAAVDPQTGDLATVSAKCAELDTDIPNHLGVSQAILDNVIFCHQEESSWPLSEPSILKKKFDEIFASTKYTNVLDSIKNIKKEKTQDLKVMHSSLEFIRRNREKAEKIRESLAKNIETTQSSQQRIDQLELDIDKCADEVSRLMEKTKEMQAIETTLSALSHEHKATLANIQDLEGTFTLYPESDSDLQEMLYKHDFSLKTADQENAKQERTKQKAASSIANLQTLVSSNQQSIGQLKALLDSHKKKQVDRDHLISELARLYSIEGFDSLPLVSSDVSRFINRIEILVQQKLGEVEQLKSENRVKEQEIRSQMADKNAKVDMSSSLKTKTQATISTVTSKLRQQNAERAKFRSTEADLESTTKLLEEQQSALAVMKSSGPGLESLESQKRAKIADIEAFENELSSLNDQNAAQMKTAGSQARLALLKNKCSQRTEEVQSILKTNRTELLSVLKEEPMPETVEDHLLPALKGKEVALQASRLALEECTRERASYDIRMDNVQVQLQKHQSTIEECERKITAECGTEPLPDLLASKEEAVAELREQVQDMKTMSTMYGRFVVLAEKKHACPLCSRGFDQTLEAQFTAKLRKLMEKAENDDERELAALETNLASLRSLKSVWDTIEHLKTSETPALQKQLAELEDRRGTTTAALETVGKVTATLSTEVDDLRRLVTVAKNVSDLCRENNKDGSAIKELETELLCTGTSQTSEELRAEYNNVKQKVQVLRQEQTYLQQQINQTTSDMLKKQQVVQSLKDKFNKLQNDRHQLAQLCEHIAETEATIQNLTTEMKQHETENENVKPELERLNKMLRQATVEGQAKEMNAQQDVAELQKNFAKVQMYNKDLERMDARTTMTELSKLEAVTDSYMEEIQQHTDDIQATEKQMKVLQEQLTGFKSLQRNIDDNLRYRRYKAKVQETEAKIAETSVKKDGEAQGTYSRQLKRLSQRQSDLTAEKAGLKGELRQLQDQKRQYEDELSGEYKDVVQKYHDSLIAYKTTELALQDLDKYTKALQSAIVEYHSMKMEEINKTIKELWTNTYRGTDIDTIEIRSDQEGMRANQSYNYRVVMIQRGRALDMRGRCSAGQKVLASIIIRLALADSFSLNCGIMALDEPTTNLDEANVAQLAQSLRTIIEKHRRQSNFQLIVITHDEDFLKMLNLTDYVDYYYRVQKNADQFSVVHKLPVTDT